MHCLADRSISSSFMARLKGPSQSLAFPLREPASAALQNAIATPVLMGLKLAPRVL